MQPAAAGAGGNAGSGGLDGAAGASGAAGSALGRACTAATTMVAPSNGLLANFDGADGGLDITGGIYAYPASGSSDPTISTLDGALHITESAALSSATQYVGAAFVFGDCIDATAFTGIQFTISGSISGCTMQYATGDVEHQDPTTDPSFATGAVGAYPAQTALDPSQVTSTPQTLMMPFTSSTTFGNPQTPLDKTKLVVLLWQFTIPAETPTMTDAAPTSCVADITIDNLAFY